MKARLLAVTPYGPAAASSRVRVRDWLQNTGIEAEVLDYIGAPSNRPSNLVTRGPEVLRAEAALREAARSRPSRLLLHREASPFSRGGIESRLLARAEFAVYDFDDALMWDHRNTISGRMWPKPLKTLTCVRRADRVIAGSSVLADWASEHHPDVRLIPSCVEPTDYVVKDAYELHDPPVLLWLGSPSTEKYLLGIAPALREVHRTLGARVRVISGGAQLLPGLETIVDRVQWTPDFALMMPSADLALAPLPDTPMARGKCAYKVLQYGATGLPIVGSPVGANEQVLQHLAGVSARSLDDWISAIDALLTKESESRERRGKHAFQVVASQFSFDAWEKEWRSCLDLDP